MINNERKHFGLRASRIVRAMHASLSVYVRLDLGEDRERCTFTFSESFVRFVGLHLPRGCSPQDPAYISVTYANGVYTVRARYVAGGDFATLWHTTTRPTWIPKEKANATCTPQAEAGRPRRGIEAYRARQADRAGKAGSPRNDARRSPSPDAPAPGPAA